MEAAFKAHPPESFASDFTTHDRATLAALDPAEPFAWRLYRMGTHLLRFPLGARREADVLKTARTVADEGDFPNGLWILWTGAGEAREVPCAAVEDFIHSLYARRGAA
jgi:hypothetical protein